MAAQITDGKDGALFSPKSTALILFFGCIFFVTSALAANQVIGIVCRFFGISIPSALVPWQPHQVQSLESSSYPLKISSINSIYSFLVNWSIFGMVLLYAYTCEQNPPFPHTSKPFWDPDQLVTWMVMVLGGALYYGDPIVNAKRPTSPLEQVERILQESKGWTFLIFVLHHCYEHENSAGSLAIHLFTSVYVCCASFHHAIYFYVTSDLGEARLLRSVWRPACLLFFFPITMTAAGEPQILYFLCIMELFSLLVTFLVFRVNSSVNDTRWGLRGKVVAAGVLLYLIWDMPNPRLFLWIFGMLFPTASSSMGILLDDNKGALWEWYVLSTQHHWCTLFGIAVALNLPVYIIWQDKLGQKFQHSAKFAWPSVSVVIARLVVACALMIVTCLGWIWLQPSGAPSSNQFHLVMAYIFSFPILAFLYVRTCTNWLRQQCLRVLELIGQYSLEAYVLHHHVLLSSNGHKLLALLSPAWPKLGFLVTVVIFLGVSYLLFSANESIRDMLFSDAKMAVRNVAIATAHLTSCLVLGTFLKLTGLLQGWVILISVMACGVVTFSLILRTTKEQSTNNNAQNVSLMAGAISIFALGIFLQVISGGRCPSSIEAQSSCQQTLQQGSWFPVNVCNEGTQSYAYRKYGVSSIATCAKSPRDPLAWGWGSSGSTSCPSMARDADDLLWTMLKHRNLTFVGDSMVRHLYHATCRQVGHIDAGAYNTTLGKWSDYSRHYKPDTSLEFRWAPYVHQILSILQDLQKSPPKQRPDVLIVGGGAWDLLHHTRTEGNKTILASYIQQLGQELVTLRKLRQYIIWVEPTQINTWALLTEDKRMNMREDQMIQLRQQYVDAGVPGAASFVLGGVSFTRDRVAESYDGVHYPFSVYDGGSQILLNAVDWLIPRREELGSPLEYGSMAHPVLGLLALALLVISLVSMDLMMGFGYLVTLFVPSASPAALYEESMSLVLKRGEELRPLPSNPIEERDLSELDAFLTKETTSEECDSSP